MAWRSEQEADKSIPEEKRNYWNRMRKRARILNNILSRRDWRGSNICIKRCFFEKSNIERVIYVTSDRVITSVPFRHTRIPQEDTSDCLIIKFGVDWTGILDKTRATKNTW